MHWIQGIYCAFTRTQSWVYSGLWSKRDQMFSSILSKKFLAQLAENASCWPTLIWILLSKGLNPHWCPNSPKCFDESKRFQWKQIETWKEGAVSVCCPIWLVSTCFPHNKVGCWTREANQTCCRFLPLARECLTALSNNHTHTSKTVPVPCWKSLWYMQPSPLGKAGHADAELP